jgi:hypothetical protein
MAKIRITQEQYDRLFKPLLENKIKPNRVKDALNNELAEEEKITQEPLDMGFDANLGSSKSQKRIPMSKAIETNVKIPNINEGDEKSKKVDMTKEVQSLVKFLYRQENELSDFLKEKGISFDDIKEGLKGKIIERNGKYELSKSCGTKEETYRTLENMLREMTGTYEEIEEDYPAGAEHDSSAPYNQKDIHVQKFPTDYEVISNDYKIAIVRDTTTNEFFLLDVYGIDSEFQEIQPEEITNHIENEGLGDAEPITLETIDNIEDLYDLDKDFPKTMNWVKKELSGGNIEEMSTGSAMGIGGVGTPSNSPVGPMTMVKKPLGEAMTATPDTIGQYDAPGLANITRDGKFKKDGKKPKAFKVPQWAGGEMVEQPECSKMNNNKEAQNGGCNSGASSLKTKKLSGSVNAPSIGENRNYSVYKVHKVSLTESMNMMKEMDLDEDLELRQVGDRIEVFSNNPDAKKGGNETFKHKKMFSKKDSPNNFFDWDGNKKAWYTSIENRDAAVKLIDQINKSSFNATEDYTVDKIVQELEGLRKDLARADVNGASCPKETSCSPKEELDARIVAFMEDLINETDSEKVAAKIKEYLDFRKNFHKYSLYNTMLIMLQKPNATRVAGMKVWNNLGRRVKAGSKGIGILKPIFPDNQDKNTKKPEIDLTDLDDLMNKAASYQPLRYIVVYVFDVSDTEGAELTQELQWWTGDDENEKAMKMVFFTEQFIKSLGIRLTNEKSRRGERGYSADGIINIPDNVKGTGRLSVLVHELSHELLHWPKSKFYIGDEHKTDKRKLELQAESISYVVLRHYEMEQYSELNHANYLAGWGRGGDTTAGEKLRKELDVVTNVGKYIINGIDAIAEKSEKKNR